MTALVVVAAVELLLILALGLLVRQHTAQVKRAAEDLRKHGEALDRAIQALRHQ